MIDKPEPLTVARDFLSLGVEMITLSRSAKGSSLSMSCTDGGGMCIPLTPQQAQAFFDALAGVFTNASLAGRTIN